MKVFSPVLSAVTAVIILATPLAASADMYQEGDIIVRAGIGVVSPNEKSEGTTLGHDAVALDNAKTFAFSGTYIISPHFGVELLAALPFKHEVSLSSNGTKVADIEHLPPTLTLQYYFPNAGLPIHPYIGGGVNYTAFINDDTAEGFTDIDLDSSFGLAFQAGMDIELNENWSLNGAVWYMDIDTEATINPGPGEIKQDIEIDPWVYMAGVAYKF